MRWKRPQIGDIRVVTKFLLFPCRIWGDCRWLEYAALKQEYVYGATRRFLPGWHTFAFQDCQTPTQTEVIDDRETV